MNNRRVSPPCSKSFWSNTLNEKYPNSLIAFYSLSQSQLWRRQFSYASHLQQEHRQVNKSIVTGSPGVQPVVDSSLLTNQGPWQTFTKRHNGIWSLIPTISPPAMLHVHGRRCNCGLNNQFIIMPYCWCTGRLGAQQSAPGTHRLPVFPQAASEKPMGS